MCAAAVLMGAAILLLPLGRHRFAQWAGAPIDRGASQTPHAGSAPAESFTASQRAGAAAADKAEPAVRARAVESYGKLPLSFEINKGQTDQQVKFLSRGGGYSLFLTGNEAVLALRKGNSNGKRQMAKGKSEFQHSPFDAPSSLLQRPASFPFPVSNFPTPATDNEPRTTDAVLHMKLVGANPHARVIGLEELPGKSNYLIGNDPKKWRANVPNYAKVKYANVYPGVDLVYYGNQGQLEYDFVVHPGADPRSIQLALVSDGQVGTQQKTVGSTMEAQDRAAESQSAIDNRKSSIPTALHVSAIGGLVVGTDAGEVIFHKPVVYQPATYNELRTTNGGGRDFVEAQYVLRGDNRIAFKLAGYDRRRPVVIDPVLAYSTYMGGSSYEYGGTAIAVDPSGNAYVTGYTGSSDFPTTPGAFQTTFHSACCANAFVSKLNASGSALVYSTYLGGNVFDQGSGIAVDASGNAYVSGSTSSSDFPTTTGAFQTTYGGGNSDAFIAKLNATGSALLYSTYLGGSGSDWGQAIAIDASGNAYVTGQTDQPPPSPNNFPVTPGAFQTTFGGGGMSECYFADAFVSKLNPTGSALVYSTYLGGNDDEQGTGIAVDASGSTYVSGHTFSTNFPTTWAPSRQHTPASVTRSSAN
jgi:hypothetical protein